MVIWNNDWDGAPLVVGDYLLEGGENSWFYVIRLNRGYDRTGKVRVRPKIVLARAELGRPPAHRNR